MIRTWESHRLSLPVCAVSLNLSTVKLQSLAVLLLFRGIMNKEKKTEATEILINKYNQLGRLPKRAEFTAEELSSFVLKALKEDAESYLKEEVTENEI